MSRKREKKVVYSLAISRGESRTDNNTVVCFLEKLQTRNFPNKRDNINQFVESDLKTEMKLRCRQIGREIKLQQLYSACISHETVAGESGLFFVAIYANERSKTYRIELN